MNQLLEYANEVILDYPDLRQDITELVQLCYDELEEGYDASLAIDVCLYGIKELIEQ